MAFRWKASLIYLEVVHRCIQWHSDTEDHSNAIHSHPSLKSTWLSRKTHICRLHSVRTDPTNHLYWRHFPRRARASVTCCPINQQTSLHPRAWFLYAVGLGFARSPRHWQQQGRHPVGDRRFEHYSTEQQMAKTTDNTIYRLCTNWAHIRKLLDDLQNKKKPSFIMDGLTSYNKAYQGMTCLSTYSIVNCLRTELNLTAETRS